MRSYLGQNFLVNKDKIKEIVDVLDLKNNDIIVEIGPGHGELTRELMIKNRGLRVIAIEKDKNLANDLKEKFKKDKNVEIIGGDALKILPNLISNYQFPITNYKIVGNIPYYITGHLLRIIGELENKPSLIVLTVQKEVAERICGMRKALARATHSRNANAPIRIERTGGGMNLLAASVQFWSEPKIISYVPKEDFSPVPDVDSAVITLRIKDRKLKIEEKENYYEFIKILFKQPRKTIINNLIYGFKNLTKAEIIENLMKLKINPEARPQDLDIENIIAAAKKFQ